ncbi:serine/threonine protein phosphatase [Luminiphilus sp.]|nr:serine/threonine protein phosphatase [Luminiphilus sp.]
MNRYLAVGDIHGCRHAFEALLESVRPTSDDIIIVLGDYVDRGPDSAGVIDLLLDLDRSNSLVALRGNHEWMMLESRDSAIWRRSWLSHGGAETLASYGIERADPDAFEKIPPAHLDFLSKGLQPYWESDSSIFVHAFVEPHKSLTKQSDASLYWRRFVNPKPHMSRKKVICGHTPQRNGVPGQSNGWVCIDTFAYDPSGWLSCLDVENEVVWQANEAGSTRQFSL